MAKQVKIKDIARLAGVSAGTVDRVLHKRGNVSQESREAVEKVLAKVGYKYNIHTSAVSFRKQLNLIITIPESQKGEYWDSIKSGIDQALDEFSDIKTECRYLPYDQFDANSCKKTFDQITTLKPDAVIIGPTYIDETQNLCKELDESDVPYIFIDCHIEGTSPLATFSSDQSACGELAARLILMNIPEGASIGLSTADRSGNRISNNSSERRKSFNSYIQQNSPSTAIKEIHYNIHDFEENINIMRGFLELNTDLKAIAVLNSRGHMIADILHVCKRSDIKVLSFDLTAQNIKYLKNGQISILLCQRPEQQGFNAIRTLINHLLYKNVEEGSKTIMPIDILLKENLPYYTEII